MGGRAERTDGVLGDDREEAERQSVPRGHLDALLGRDAGEDQGRDAVSTEPQLERRPNEKGGRRLLDDRLAWPRIELGDDLDVRRADLHGGLQLRSIVHLLPLHQAPQSGRRREIERRRDMAAPDDEHTGGAGGREQRAQRGQQLGDVVGLRSDTGLHVPQRATWGPSDVPSVKFLRERPVPGRLAMNLLYFLGWPGC